MAKATLFILIAVAAGLLVYLLASPKFTHVDSSRVQQQQGNTATSTETQPLGDSHLSAEAPQARLHSDSADVTVDTAPTIDVPLTSEQRSQENLELRRSPLYEWIRSNTLGILVGWQPSSADPATLDLYMSRADSYASQMSLCMDNLVAHYATKYGFNHVRFFAPNPPTDIDQWHVDSEATPDANGKWNLYKK